MISFRPIYTPFNSSFTVPLIGGRKLFLKNGEKSFKENIPPCPKVRKRVMKDCDMCDFSADRKSILRKHMKEMHFQCDQCKKFAATKFGLVVHKRKKHGRVVKPVATDYLQVENRTQQNSVKSEEVENQVIPGDHTEEKDLFSKVNIENPFYNPE